MPILRHSGLKPAELAPPALVAISAAQEAQTSELAQPALFAFQTVAIFSQFSVER